VKILSGKIPATGRIIEESVKVCTPEPPSPTDDSPLDLSPGHVVAHGTGTQTEDFGGFSQRKKVALIDCIVVLEVSFHYIPFRLGVDQFAFVAESLPGRLVCGFSTSFPGAA
jgi:hypothetical protein